jgi:tRNA(Ile)-lysidine synthetase, C-terminal domain
LLLKPTAPENLIKPPSHNKFVVDAEKIKGTLSIRRRRSGDYFYPIGMQVRKTVSKYLTDKKTPAYLKKYAFVITDDEKINCRTVWCC